MTNLEYKAALQSLREQYKTAEEKEQAKIQYEAELLKKLHGCYQCQENVRDEESEFFPFCTFKCHTTWANTHHKGQGLGKSNLTIEEMQGRLRQMK